MTSHSFRESWYDFTQETSMHGIRYIHMKKVSILRRVLWSLMILGMLTYFCYAGYLFLDAYLRRSINTKTTVRNMDNLTFPTVTICNRNSGKSSKSDNPAIPERERQILQEMMKDLFLPYTQSPPPAEKYNWTDPFLAAWVSTDIEVSDLLIQSAHSLEETFTRCVINGIVRPCEELFSQVLTDAEVCYQFNGDGSFVSHTAGLSGGVQFYMDALTHEYYIGPFSMSEGFSVVLHDPDVVPLISEFGYGLRPGAHTSMIVQRKQARRVPPPADGNQSDCFDAKRLINPLHYYKAYSQTGCQYECSVSHVLRKCGCVDFLHPKLNNSRTCDTREVLYCAIPAKREYLSNTTHIKACACKSLCDETQYSAKLSTYNFPSERYFQYLEGDQQVSTEYMRKNYVVVDIYYGQMSYELLEEEIAYKVPDMIASLGGTFGVCIGASLLTLLEFIEFLIISVSKAAIQCREETNRKTRVQASVPLPSIAN